MAITKGRLEELIKEGATIYTILRVSFIDEVSGLVGLKPYKLNKSFYIAEADGKESLMTTFLDDNNNVQSELIDYLQDLFETKKQAEWHLKYHATRIEELDLPMWEEIKESGCDYIFFVKKGDVDFEYYFLVGEQDKSIQILSRQIERIMLNYGYDVIYNKKLTEENYIEACDLCLKLYNGEEI